MNARLFERRALVARVLKDRGDGLVVAGLGAPAWDCAAAGDNPRTFYLWGGMGLAVPVGLGLALAQPKRRVVVVTGDGEAMMGLGAIAVAGVEAARNLAVLILDNESFGETGGQRGLTAAGVDLAAMALAAGFKSARAFTKAGDPAPLARMLWNRPGPVLAVAKIQPGRAPMVLPPKDGAFLKDRLRTALSKKTR